MSLGFTDRPAQACNGGTADGVSLQPDVGCGLQMCALSTPKDAPFVFWALTSSLSFLFPLLCQFLTMEQAVLQKLAARSCLTVLASAQRGTYAHGKSHPVQGRDIS